jgi:acetyl esterase/lipase
MSTSTNHTPPPFDPELAPILEVMRTQIPPSVIPSNIEVFRQARDASVEDTVGDRALVWEDHVAAGTDGAPDVVLTSFRRADHVAGSAAVYFIHGGGMMLGTRFGGGLDIALEWVDELDVVVVTVEYRLAPEHPDPAPIDDCFAGLEWVIAHADELGFDPARVIVAGGSAGGGLAAGIALKARDEDGPALIGQMLIYPMIDDRNETLSSYQIDGIGVWDRTSNETGWDSYLGDRRKTDSVSIYAAPSRATDLSGLPPTFIDCASAEVFRDEDIDFASRIWAAGGVAELHVWPGGFHGFDAFVPTAVISQAARAARTAWLRRLLA